MLNIKFPGVVLLGHSLLFITTPAGINQFPALTGSFTNEVSTTDTPQNKKALPIGPVDTMLTAQASTFPMMEATAPKVRLNKNVSIFVTDYIKENDECLVLVKKRSKLRFGMMDSVMNRYGLPVELKYLAVIESELKATALSRVGAAGPWQLMPQTAKLLGLKITHRYDERTHYFKSTRAAAIYLKDLYREFGDWLLVLAAYNGGPGPVYKAIRRSGSRNFWKLQAYLPTETRMHVKRFIATHYYFEGKGSVTTLTKTEMLAYNKTMAAFLAKHKKDTLAMTTTATVLTQPALATEKVVATK